MPLPSSSGYSPEVQPVDEAETQQGLHEIDDYISHERPRSSTNRVFVALKGPGRGDPLSTERLDEILAGARRRVGLKPHSCTAARPSTRTPRHLHDQSARTT